MCGFVAPPSKFQDPDVDMHKKLDLRADQAPEGQDVAGFNSDVNDADGDGLDDNTGEPVADEQAGSEDVQPLLTCPVCGFEAEAAHPVSVSTEDPQAGASSGDGAAEGDLCPNCGKGVMESGTEIAEQGLDPEADPDAVMDDDEVDPRDADPDADPDLPPEEGDPEDPDDAEREFPPDADEEEPDEFGEEDDEDVDPADPAQDPRLRRKRSAG